MNDLFRRHGFSVVLLLLMVVAIFWLRDGDAEIHQLGGFTMGTSYQIQMVGLPDDMARDEIASAVTVLLNNLDSGIFSSYASESELSRFNRHRVGVPFVASAELVEVLEIAKEVSQLSAGAFDVTVGPLVNLWGFGPVIRKTDTAPSAESINAARYSVGYQHLVLDSEGLQLIKSRDVTVDLSAVAKGYAVDKLAEYFDALQVDSYFLEIGGELKIKGLKPGGESWVPAIEAPLDTESQVYEVFFSNGEQIAVAGSGDYRNYFEEAGVRYSHEIDPRTGRPVSHNLAAAYVIDDSAARADALATAFMILGLDAARALAERQDQAVYFIYKNDAEGFDEYVSSAFARYLQEQ